MFSWCLKLKNRQFTLTCWRASLRFFSQSAGFIGLRHQANRNLSKCQLVTMILLMEPLFFKMAALTLFPLLQLTNRNWSPCEGSVSWEPSADQRWATMAVSQTCHELVTSLSRSCHKLVTSLSRCHLQESLYETNQLIVSPPAKRLCSPGVWKQKFEILLAIHGVKFTPLWIGNWGSVLVAGELCLPHT